jgi:serine protease SohB
MAFPTLPQYPWLDRMLSAAHKLVPARFRGDVPVVPVVRLSGTIGFSTPLRPGLTLTALARTLDRAFSYRHAKAVAIVINSPGGSAVQSHLIFGRIRQLAETKGVPVIAFVEDVAASGGYMIACAADEIIGDPSSIVGSIGVVGGSFGFHRLIEKIGVERRLYTSGEHKAMLDPFLPEEPGDVQRLKAIQREIHDSFIALVKGRRLHLSGDEAELFSGEYWTGRRALELGLIDGLGDVRTVLRERFGDKVLTPLIASDRGWFGRRAQGVGAAGLELLEGRTGFADDIVSALETRALWARFGL